MRRHVIFMVLLAFPAVVLSDTTTSPIIQNIESKPRAKDWEELPVDDDQPRRFVEISADIELICPRKRDEFAARSLSLLRGIYPIERRLHSKKGGSDWLIVPALSSVSAKFGYNNSAGRTWGYRHSIALNAETLAIFPREIVSYTQEWSRLDGSRWNEATWTFGCAPSLVATPEQIVLRYVTKDQMRGNANRQSRQVVLGALEQGLQRKAVLDQERPKKSQIGVQLCKESGPLILQGFTEGKSPDNNKIQIRIWRGSLSDHGQPSSVVPSDFRESIVWDDPDNWRQCDR